MLPTFVIGLREGLEAALIVGIIAAFLRKQGRRDLLRWVYAGVATAVLLCVAVGFALDSLSKDLPQRQQEGLETVIGVLAVGMVTYMVIWMKRHSRELKGQLEGLAADAMGPGNRGAWAMIAMAFLAVLREGFETVVFLLAAFNESGNGAGATLGAVVGIAVAVVLGYGIYRGGVRLNLSKFFRATGLVLVLVAAGLVVTALHTAHEAGWLDFGQTRTVDLTWLVRPGSVQSSLLTGMLGIQSHPVVVEVVGWLLYLVPVACFVAWPPGRAVPRRSLVRVLAGVAAVGVVACTGLMVSAPSQPGTRPETDAGSVTARLTGPPAESVTVRTQSQHPASHRIGAEADVTVRRTGVRQYAGVAGDVYRATLPEQVTGRAPRLNVTQLARVNGGRLPLGVHPGADGKVAVRYPGSRVLEVMVEPRTGRVVDLHWTETVRAEAVHTTVGTVPLADPVASGTAALPATARAQAASAAAQDVQRLDRRAGMLAGAWACLACALVALLGAAGVVVGGRRLARTEQVADPVATPVGS
jgi:high-affinity iron transporter